MGIPRTQDEAAVENAAMVSPLLSWLFYEVFATLSDLGVYSNEQMVFFMLLIRSLVVNGHQSDTYSGQMIGIPLGTEQSLGPDFQILYI